MRALKIVVIVLGALNVAGFGALGIVIVNRMVRADGRPSAPPAAPSAPMETALDLPDGASIAETLVAGGLVVIHVRIPNAPDRLYVLDPRSGAVTATITAGHR